MAQSTVTWSGAVLKHHNTGTDVVGMYRYCCRGECLDMLKCTIVFMRFKLERVQLALAMA